MNHIIANETNRATPHRLGTDEFGRDLYCAPSAGWFVMPSPGFAVEFDTDGNYVIVPLVPAAFAAVGTDGVRLVVWGLGGDADAALEDARRWLRDAAPEWNEAHESLEVHPITAEQAEAIEGGDVAWPPK